MSTCCRCGWKTPSSRRKIILLDEATAFADPENENKIQKAFQNLAKDKTVLLIAHRLSTIEKADRILVVDSGRIVEEGDHLSLLAKDGLYARMWKDYRKATKWRVCNA